MVRPRGRGRGANAPPPPDYMAAMMQQFEVNRQFIQGIVNQMGNNNNNNQNNNHHQQPGPISLQDFARLNPPFYRNSAQPLDADDWLRDITYQMESANVAPDSFVNFAAFQLRGPAAQWWDTHKRSLPVGTVVTWQEFQTAFRARHIPQGIMDRKKREFRNFTQGRLTVEAYQREFLDLSRYAEDDVSTDARKQEKFREGLHPDIKLALTLHEFPDFATLVNKAIQTETSQIEHKETLKRTRDVGSSSGPSAQKRRVWIPHNVYHQAAPAPRPSYVAPRPPPPPPRQTRIQTGQPNVTAPRPTGNACFKCGRPGHFARDCRQDQKQLALPSTVRGNNQPRNSNARPSTYGRGQS